MACRLGDARLGYAVYGPLRASVKSVNGVCRVPDGAWMLCRVQWIQLWLDLRYQEGSRGDSPVLNLRSGFTHLYTRGYF